jgi:hypothetical protein
MKPKEKAEELVLKFKELPQEGTVMFYLAFEISKQCALIAVDEIYKELTKNVWIFNGFRSKYWEEVKQEIEKL